MVVNDHELTAHFIQRHSPKVEPLLQFVTQVVNMCFPAEKPVCIEVVYDVMLMREMRCRE